MPKKIYLDESGDLGWKFTAPYRNGGSSRFLTLGYIVVPYDENKRLYRFVKKMYEKYKISPTVEFKASTMSLKTKTEISKSIIELLNNNPSFILGAITVNKQNVKPHIRVDGEKLYNYMCSLSVLHHILQSPNALLTRDVRSVKVQSGKSCIDYLQTKLWFEHGVPTIISDLPCASHTNLSLIFIDWICNFVWSYYEDGVTDMMNILAPKLNNQTLFF